MHLAKNDSLIAMRWFDDEGWEITARYFSNVLKSHPDYKYKTMVRGKSRYLNRKYTLFYVFSSRPIRI